ncbi:MAG: VaFE repeat-containing surface-anchored protein [Lactococcus garvieae]
MKKQNETKQGNFRMWKSKKGWVYAGALLLVVGGSTGAVLAQTGGLKVFNAPARSLPKPPNSGTVNFQYSGTGSAKWSDGHVTSANFMKVNGQTTFCLDPFTDVFIGANATQAGQNDAAMKQWKAMTEYQQNLINNVTYIGLMNDADNDPNINLSTQVAQWMIEGKQNQIPGLIPTISELDTSKLNNVIGGRTISDLESSGANIQQVVGNATTIIKQAIAAAKDPDFNPNPLEVIAGSSATATDKNGVLAGGAGGYSTPFDNILPSEGLTAKRKGNSLEVSATTKAIGKLGDIKVWNNQNRDFVPSYIYGTINPDSSVGQTLFCASAPALLTGQLKVKVIGLGEVELQKSSTNNAFTNKTMAGAEFTLYNKDGSPVKWSDGQTGHPITATSGTKANNTNVVLKMGEDAKLGLKNLDFTKEYYFMETKAPAGFALNAVKIPVQFDENSKFNGSTNNYQDSVNTQDIPLGATSLTKVDADTDSSETQGEATLEGVTYGLFHKDGKAVEWSEGLTDKTPGATENLPITPTYGTKADDKKVELTIDDSNKVGVQNLPLKENNKSFYWQEVRTSSGYSHSTKKIPVEFDESNEVNVSLGDFDDNVKAADKVNVFSFMFSKVQDVNGSLPGLNGAEFTLTPQGETKGNPIVAVSGTGVDSNGFTVNGLTVFDGKANEAAGNPSKDGIAIGGYLLTETKTPEGLKAINPIALVVDAELDKEGAPLSYTATFTDTVTGQQIDKLTVDASHMVDNNVMFKLNLGTFTDKPEEKPTPTITTTAKDKADGDKILGVGQAQVTDMAQLSGLAPLTEYTLTGKVVYKDSGKEVKDENGKVVTATKKFKTDENGSASVQLDFPVINTVKDQDKDFTVTELVTDKDGNKVVEENNYQDNPSQTVKVDEADGHTEVQDKEITPETTTVTDKFFYEGLVKGDTYTVKITQAYDHDLKKVIDVDGSLTFKAEDTSGTVEVPVKVDAKKYAGHKITFYEDAWHGEKPNEKETPIISHHNKEDEKETFTVKKPETPSKPKETPQTPDKPKNILPDTGEEKALWSLAGLGMVLAALAIWKRDKIKALFNKGKK